jgi:hypothetical protein
VGNDSTRALFHKVCLDVDKKGVEEVIKRCYSIGKAWDRMAQFYASLETGHVTASTALKLIVGFTSKTAHLIVSGNLRGLL